MSVKTKALESQQIFVVNPSQQKSLIQNRGIDGSGFAYDMPRTHGYAPRGKHCVGIHDWQAKGRINVIGALLARTLLTVGLTTCNVDADIFNLWLKERFCRKF